MSNKILIHLVIVGKNPVSGEYSVGIRQDSEEYLTIQDELDNDPDAEICRLSTKYIEAPLDWYEVRKQTFIKSEEAIHLIYTVTVPSNIKLKKNAKWFSIAAMSNGKFHSEIEKDIIIQGIKL